MQDFAEIEAKVIERFGGEQELDARLTKPKSPRTLKNIADGRWLSEASKAVFQAGFNWKVVDNKWPRIEEIFHDFDLSYCRFLSDEALEDILKQDGMISHWKKTKSIQRNADFFWQLSGEHGGLGNYFAGWNSANYADNLKSLQKGGDRLGGKTAQVFLRRMGVDTLVFSNDMVQGLIRAGVVQKTPSSKKDWAALQEAIELWQAQSGRSLNAISQILAFSVG
ncbi:DNA-3-methyladenine glycosylase I [Microbulbifer donghaiensis]|uniref:DNA-3-methyladenine glycosylase I n=1 Tax=Microbulbifer donghaiensis TaxID=494016 RepID=A0A1M4XHF7_9GAMM|nr:DNA-3-methyladenine glycosylase I [Microbulbifer donghaiensis]SHE92582.1 DNA-3-methyladenine glycosylase I [Microbulbifer donghaiensis]